MQAPSEIRLRGVATKDAEVALTPSGVPAAVVDVAVEEFNGIVYVPVLLLGGLALEVCREPIMRQPVLVGGHFRREAKTSRTPFPRLLVEARYFKRLPVHETGSLFPVEGGS